MKQKVLFICTNNSARSQIAEGFLNTLFNNNFEAYSAGLKQSSVNPYAVLVMKKVGIDISKQRSKTIEEFKNYKFDIVITVCDNAKETCHFFPSKKVIHKSFKDPAKYEGCIGEKIINFKKTRDEIKDWIIKTFE